MKRIKPKGWQLVSLILVSILSFLVFGGLYSSQSIGAFGQGIYSSSELGSDVLAHFNGMPHLIYDTNRIVNNRTAANEMPVFGFYTVVSNSSIIVANIIDNSSAANAGMSNGDVVVSINGIEVAGMNDSQFNNVVDKEDAISLVLQDRAGKQYSVELKRTLVPVSKVGGSIIVKDSTSATQIAQAVQDNLDSAEYEVILSPRAVPLAVIAWIIIDLIVLIIATMTLPRMSSLFRAHRFLSIICVVLLVAVSTAVIIVSSVFIPFMYSTMLMGVDNDMCGGFICIDPAPVLLFGGFVMLTFINSSLVIWTLFKRGKDHLFVAQS